MKNMLYVYYGVLSIVTLILYGIDKHKAIRHEWRLSESTLLLPAALGGAYGALIGMLLFHHKTRKMKFVILVPLFVIIHTVILLMVIR